MVGLPIVFLWHKESTLSARDRLNQDIALEKLNMKVSQWNKRGEVIENLGIQHFGQIPILDLHGQMGETNYIDFLQPQDLSAPIMKGQDKYGRPFIALKLINQETGNLFVATLFQRYQDSDRWIFISREDQFNTLMQAVVGPREEEIFQQVLYGIHPNFHLAY